MKKKSVSGLLCLCMVVFIMPTVAFAVDRGERSVAVGGTITLDHTGSYPWTWSVEDDTIVSLEPSGRPGQDTYGSTCTVTGLRPGTTTVRLGYSELVFDANADPDWYGGPGSGENTIRHRTDTWTITVTDSAEPDDSSGKEPPAEPTAEPSAAARYTVEFRANGGSGTMRDQSANSQDTYTIPACAFTAPFGQEFQAWRDDSGKTFYPGDRIQISGPDGGVDTFTAVWKAVPSAASPSFTDVSPSDWFYESVQWAVGNGITSGTSATTFSPRRVCTHGEFITFLWRANGSPEPEAVSEPPFGIRGVSPDDYFYKAALWACQKGVVDQRYVWFDFLNCDRKDAARYLWRAAGSPETSTELVEAEFSDVSGLAQDDQYVEAIVWAVQEGVASGTAEGIFSPDNDCTRAEIMTLLYRAYGP